MPRKSLSCGSSRLRWASVKRTLAGPLGKAAHEVARLHCLHAVIEIAQKGVHVGRHDAWLEWRALGHACFEGAQPDNGSGLQHVTSLHLGLLYFR